MNILVLNGSPRKEGNTAAMVEAFAAGAWEAGHQVDIVPVCQKKIAGCLACEYCHTKYVIEDAGSDHARLGTPPPNWYAPPRAWQAAWWEPPAAI